MSKCMECEIIDEPAIHARYVLKYFQGFKVIDLLITFVVRCEQTSYCKLHVFGCVHKCSSFRNNCKTD